MLGEGEIGDQALIALCLLDGVEVGSLEVFDEREGEEGSVIDLLDDGGDLGPAESGGGAESAFAGDQLVACSGWCGADGDGLEESAGSEARLELGEFFGSELLSRLVGVGTDLGDGELPEGALVLGFCGCGGLGGDEGFQSAAEAAWLLSGHRRGGLGGGEW